MDFGTVSRRLHEGAYPNPAAVSIKEFEHYAVICMSFVIDTYTSTAPCPSAIKYYVTFSTSLSMILLGCLMEGLQMLGDILLTLDNAMEFNPETDKVSVLRIGYYS